MSINGFLISLGSTCGSLFLEKKVREIAGDPSLGKVGVMIDAMIGCRTIEYFGGLTSMKKDIQDGVVTGAVFLGLNTARRLMPLARADRVGLFGICLFSKWMIHNTSKIVPGVEIVVGFTTAYFASLLWAPI